MSCINKSLPGYKSLAKIYGDEIAESFVRGYSKQIKLLPDNEFYYPSPSEVTKYLASNKGQIVQTIEFVLETNPNISEQALKGLLRGVAHMNDGAFYITSGVGRETDPIMIDVRLTKVFRPNLRILETLVDKFPNIFSITDTKKAPHTKIVKITAPKGVASEMSGNRPDEQIVDKYFSDGYVQKTSNVLQKIANSKHPLNKLAKHLLGFSQINNVEIVLEDVPFFENINPNVKKAGGYYTSSENKIYIAKNAIVNQGLSEKVLLHEILHALSYKLIRNNSKMSEDFEKLYNQAVSNLGEYKSESKEGFYALMNMDEFFVGLFTDSKFIQALKTIPAVDGVKYTNLFQELIDYILDLLKLNKESSVYDQAFSIATQFLGYEQERVAALSATAQQEADYYSSLENAGSPIEDVKPGVQELFDSNPELANQVYETLGFGKKLKTSLGKELEYKDPYVSESRLKNFKQYQVLDESNKNIGTVVIEYRGDKSVILHPKLNVTGKGYGKDLYKLISNTFNVEIQEWNEGAIDNSSSAKKMWDSLEKEGVAKRVVDVEQGDSFRTLKYNNQITPQQKQQALQQYSQYLDGIFPDSKVKDIVYHGSINNDKQVFKNSTRVTGHYFATTPKEALQHAERQLTDPKDATLYNILLNLKNPRIITKVIDYEDLDTEAAFTKGDDVFGYDADGIIAEQVEEYNTTYKTTESSWLEKQIIVFEPEQIHILGSKQDIEGFKKFVSGDKTMLQLKGTELSKASPKTIKMIKDFLTRIGVNYEQVKNIVVNGKKLDANAIANITQKLIQIVNGKEDTALPEEAMHFAVELIQQNDPKLFNQLLKEINSYNILKDVYADYGNNPLYQTKEGKPDILKLKKEAIGKVLAEVVIGKSEGLSEASDKIAKVQTWWQKVIDFLKGLFMKSGFDTAAMKILSGEEIGNVEDLRSDEERIFLQKDSQATIYDKLRLTKSQMRLEKDGYYVNGKKVPKRVSDIVKTWYEQRFADSSLTDSEYQKSVYDLKMEKGTAGHSDLEHIFSLFVDDEGFLRDEPLDDSGYVSQINNDDRKMYNILKENLKARLNSFPKDNGGTRFLSEAMVYDERRTLGGTVDFLAIEPDGKVNILDWKFMDLDIDKWEDVPWYKISAWQKQMEQYKLILQNVYGVKNEDFKQTRMIPIKAFYSKGDGKAKTLPKLLDIAIGDVVVENITDDYLVPVGLESEKTGEPEIDDLLVKLNALYSRLSEKKVTPEGKIAKRDQLNSLFSAIRQLQMKKNVKPLIIQARLLNAQIQTIIKEYDSVWKGKEASSFADNTMGDFYKELDTLQNALIEVYANLDTDLEFLFQERELSEEDKLVQEELRNTANTARYLAKKVDKVGTEFVKTFVVGKEGVKKDITLPEKIIKGVTRLFSSTSTLQSTAVEVLFKKANRVLTYAGQDTIKESKKLQAIKKKFDTWASARGINKKNYFDILKKKGKNELVDEFEPEFYSELKSRIKDKDYAWVRDNVDQDAVRTEIQRKLEEEIQRINDKVRPGLDTDKEDMDREIYKASSLYDVSKPTSVGWLVYDTVKKFPKKDKWESKEWKELTKTENAPAKAFYDYIIERNKYYQSIKYINAADARVFLPFVRKSLIEKVFVGGDIKFGEEFLRSISIDEGDIGYGQIDPFTGQPLNKIPKYFTNEIEGELSNDLFRNMALYNETAIKFKYLTDIEDQLTGLLNVERNKQAIATSMFGKTVYEDGKIKYTPNNSENSKLLEDMIKAIVYQQRYIQSETFDQILGTIGNFGEKANKLIGIKIFPENLVGRQVSINKVITQLNNTFQLNALGLNPLSALSNLLGGTFQSIINAETYFSRVDYEGTALWMMTNKMTQGPDQKKAIGALEYFLPLTDNYNKEIAKTLSINTLSQENVQEFLMVLMRKSDYFVQSNNFYAFLRNTIVDGDRVVNVRQYLREQPEYKDMYAGGEKAIKDRKDKFEEDAKKLIEEKAVLKLATIVDGEFVIPGVDRKSNSVVELRRKVQQLNKDALGNLSEDDMRTINMTVYGKSFMIFKNWIPRPVDVRLGNLKYNSGSDAYEWGRMRNVYRIISEDVVGSISNLINSLKANDKGVDFMRKLYEKKKSDYETDTGKTLDMTESQFMDLVRKNIKAQMVDLIFLLTLFAIYAGLKANAPEDEEDEAVKNQYKFMLRAADKVKDELLYFYNPASITSLVSSGIFPSMSYLTNFSKVLKNFMLENYAIAIGDKELEDKNYVIKYLMKSFPVSNQAAGMLPMFYPELAKSLGIKAQSQAKPMGL